MKKKELKAQIVKLNKFIDEIQAGNKRLTADLAKRMVLGEEARQKDHDELAALRKQVYFLNAEADKLAALIPHNELWDWYDAERLPIEGRRRGKTGPRRMRFSELGV